MKARVLALSILLPLAGLACGGGSSAKDSAAPGTADSALLGIDGNVVADGSRSQEADGSVGALVPDAMADAPAGKSSDAAESPVDGGPDATAVDANRNGDTLGRTGDDGGTNSGTGGTGGGSGTGMSGAGNGSGSSGTGGTDGSVSCWGSGASSMTSKNVGLSVAFPIVNVWTLGTGGRISCRDSYSYDPGCPSGVFRRCSMAITAPAPSTPLGFPSAGDSSA